MFMIIPPHFIGQDINQLKFIFNYLCCFMQLINFNCVSTFKLVEETEVAL